MQVDLRYWKPKEKKKELIFNKTNLQQEGMSPGQWLRKKKNQEQDKREEKGIIRLHSTYVSSTKGLQDKDRCYELHSKLNKKNVNNSYSLNFPAQKNQIRNKKEGGKAHNKSPSKFVPCTVKECKMRKGFAGNLPI